MPAERAHYRTKPWKMHTISCQTGKSEAELNGDRKHRTVYVLYRFNVAQLFKLIRAALPSALLNVCLDRSFQPVSPLPLQHVDRDLGDGSQLLSGQRKVRTALISGTIGRRDSDHSCKRNVQAAGGA